MAIFATREVVKTREFGILAGKSGAICGVAADTALHLAQYLGLGTSAELWLGLQADFDVANTRPGLADVLSRIIPLPMHYE